MYLIYDTATAGKAQSFKAEVSDVFNWPRIIHISWVLLGEDMKPIEDHNYLITPNGWEISEDMSKRAQVESEEYVKNGNDIVKVLEILKGTAEKAKFVFAHNLKLNESVVGAECYRASKNHFMAHIESYCLMQEGTYYCKIPGKRGYKWPTLQEMHTKIFNQGFSPASNARAKTIAASRCFIALKKAGAFDDILADEDEY